MYTRQIINIIESSIITFIILIILTNLLISILLTTTWTLFLIIICILKNKHDTKTELKYYIKSLEDIENK